MWPVADEDRSDLITDMLMFEEFRQDMKSWGYSIDADIVSIETERATERETE